MPIYIYELRDPDTGLVKYVGRSGDVEKRLSQHLSQAKGGYHNNPAMTEWLTKLLEDDKLPTITIAKTTTEEQKEEDEVAHIHKLIDQGCNLLNIVIYGRARDQPLGTVYEPSAMPKVFYKAWSTFYYGDTAGGVHALIQSQLADKIQILVYNLRSERVEIRYLRETRVVERVEDSAIDAVLRYAHDLQIISTRSTSR